MKGIATVTIALTLTGCAGASMKTLKDGGDNVKGTFYNSGIDLAGGARMTCFHLEGSNTVQCIGMEGTFQTTARVGIAGPGTAAVAGHFAAKAAENLRPDTTNISVDGTVGPVSGGHGGEGGDASVDQSRDIQAGPGAKVNSPTVKSSKTYNKSSTNIGVHNSEGVVVQGSSQAGKGNKGVQKAKVWFSD